MEFTNQVVLITGASNGIGRQLAVDLSTRGAIVAGCGRFGFGTTSALDDATGSAADSAPRDGLGDTTDDGATVVCAPGFDLCDGFEGTTLDGAIWEADPMVN